jgi:hypothetical protein
VKPRVFFSTLGIWIFCISGGGIGLKKKPTYDAAD